MTARESTTWKRQRGPDVTQVPPTHPTRDLVRDMPKETSPVCARTLSYTFFSKYVLLHVKTVFSELTITLIWLKIFNHIAAQMITLTCSYK